MATDMRPRLPPYSGQDAIISHLNPELASKSIKDDTYVMSMLRVTSFKSIKRVKSSLKELIILKRASTKNSKCDFFVA